MASVVIDDTSLTAIANAIRAKNGATATYTPSAMATAILNLPSGGLEYEEGTYTPTEDTARPTISFTNAHSKAPFYVGMADAVKSKNTDTDTNWSWEYFEFYQLDGARLYYTSSSERYGCVSYIYRASKTTQLTDGETMLLYNSNNTENSSIYFARYWVTESEFYPYSGSTSRFWRVGRTYKWIAIWK